MKPLPLILEPDALVPLLGASELLILDLSKPESYQQGHVPGAINVDPARLLSGSPPVANKLPSDAQLSALFSELGLSAEKQVVVYDDQMGAWAGRMIWTLDLIGHHRAALLNGQLPAWVTAGAPLQSTVNQPTASHFRAVADRSLVPSLEDILLHLESADRVIWDARSREEYLGEKKINAAKAGHIPGARHLEWTDTLISNTDWRLKDLDSLRRLLAERGISANREVITHCQTHRRSGLTYVVAKALGYPRIRCYDGSWFEWGNHPTTPTETAATPTT